MNLIQLFLKSDSGNKYILVVLGRGMEAFPVPNIEAKTVAEKLVLEFISRLRVLYQIKCD